MIGGSLVVLAAMRQGGSPDQHVAGSGRRANRRRCDEAEEDRCEGNSRGCDGRRCRRPGSRPGAGGSAFPAPPPPWPVPAPADPGVSVEGPSLNAPGIERRGSCCQHRAAGLGSAGSRRRRRGRRGCRFRGTPRRRPGASTRTQASSRFKQSNGTVAPPLRGAAVLRLGEWRETIVEALLPRGDLVVPPILIHVDSFSGGNGSPSAPRAAPPSHFTRVGAVVLLGSQGPGTGWRIVPWFSPPVETQFPRQDRTAKSRSCRSRRRFGWAWSMFRLVC